jgi:hypothetical protein
MEAAAEWRLFKRYNRMAVLQALSSVACDHSSNHYKCLDAG